MSVESALTDISINSCTITYSYAEVDSDDDTKVSYGGTIFGSEFKSLSIKQTTIEDTSADHGSVIYLSSASGKGKVTISQLELECNTTWNEEDVISAVNTLSPTYTTGTSIYFYNLA